MDRMAHERTPSLTTPFAAGPPSISPPNYSLPLTPVDQHRTYHLQNDEDGTSTTLAGLFDLYPAFNPRDPFENYGFISRSLLQMHRLESESLTPLLPFERHTDAGLSTITSGTVTKRPLSDPEPGQLQRGHKHPRLGNVAKQASLVAEDESDDDIVYGEPHSDLGLIDGKHACTCGNLYTRHTTLKRHIDAQSATSRHPCLTCNQTFTRDDSLRRHEKMKHDGNKIACPGCKKFVRPDYLSKHLASSQNARCRVLAEAVYFQAHGYSNVYSRPPAEDYWISTVAESSVKRDIARFMSSHSPQPPAGPPTADVLARSLMVEKPAPNQPIARRSREPCDLCGMPLGPGEQELIDHIGKHSLDFSAKAYKCDACDISFAFSADLELHLKAARNGHCGFKFLHEDRRIVPSCCTGHHPPPWNMQEMDDHKAMQKTLWAWENAQLRAHRLTIARLLSERLNYRQSLRHSVPDNDLSCMAILSRLSMASIDSFRSVPAWLRYQDEINMEELDAGIRGLDLLTRDDFGQSNTAPATELPDLPRVRPESTVLKPDMVDLTSAPKTQTLDFTMQWDNGKFKPVMRNILGQQSPSVGTLPTIVQPETAGNTYIDQLRSMRSPGGLKTKASGVRFRAKAAARYLAPSNRQVHELEEVAYVQSGMA